MRRALLALAWAAVCGLAPAALWAQNGVIESLASPFLLAAGATAAPIPSPYAGMLNPAASGDAQRGVVDINYIALAGLGVAPGWGNVANLGVTVPTAAGVFSGSARYLGSSLPSLDFGSLGLFNLSFAKELSRNLSVGAGLGFEIGSDWGLGLDLGFVHIPGDLWILRDFRWGAAIRNIGKGYPSPPGTAGVGTDPPAFTPAVGASFNLVKTKDLTFGLTPDLSFPSFRDVRLTVGGGLTYRDFLRVEASYVMDLAEIQAAAARSIPFALGVSVDLNTDIKKEVKPFGFTKRGWNTSTVTLSSGVAPLRDGVWAGGLGATVTLGRHDDTPPVIAIDPPPYISPNGDGILDELPVSLKISDQRYIEGCRLVVESSGGAVVRTIGASLAGPTTKGLQNFLDRLFAVKRSIPIPEKLVWDGKDEKGQVVPDGTYRYWVEAWDDNGNLGKSRVETVVVDDTPPVAAVGAPYREFSPNGDGKKDVLIVDQHGSSEDLWKGEFLDATGKAVRHVEWEGGAPTGFTWDGKDDGGAALPDGLYRYRVAATDRAGNSGSAELAQLILNTQSTPVGIALDNPAFSPNGDGVKDEVAFTLEVPVKSGIERWSLAVKSAEGRAVRTFTGTAELPPAIPFDGRDDAGSLLAEGSYTATLAVWYANGNNPVSDSPTFTVDLTAPAVDVTAPYPEFSPNGDGNKDALPITQRGSVETLWRGTIADSAGRSVREYEWRSEAPASFQWDGRDGGGKLVPDGSYTYRITSTDAAGNAGSASLPGIVVDTHPTPVGLTIDLAEFSPNGDGVKDALTFGFVVGVKSGIERWALAVKDSSGAERRSFAGKSEIPAAIRFDGKDDTGRILAEGGYAGTLAVWYLSGNNPLAESPPFTVDLTPPAAQVSADYSVFSPNGDGNKDFITFSQVSSEEQSWKGVVVDSAGRAVKSVTWRGKAAPQFVWDGHGDDGRLLPDGKYRYDLASTDRAGNEGRSRSVAFEINTEATPVLISSDPTSFSPNGDGVKDTLRLQPTLKISSGIESYRISIVDGTGRTLREFTGSGSLPAEVAWDGRNTEGGRVPDGAYSAELSVLYRNGNNPRARSNPFVVDTLFPAITLEASDLLFSPDGDGRLDATTIRQSSSDEGLWEGEILSSAGKVVRSYFWKGRAADFSWDGRDENGNVVPDGRYGYSVKSTDAAGNATVKRVEGIVVDRRSTPLSIGVSSDGLSPNGDGVRDTIAFSLAVGLPDGIRSWRVEMMSERAGVQRLFAGGSYVPDTLTWNGRDDAGKTAAEGAYRARMTVDYLKGNRPSALTGSFLLSVTPPKVQVGLAPLPFSPDGDGVNDILTISLGAAGASPIVGWEATVLDPAGHLFTSFSGTGNPPATIRWNGLSADGELVQAAEDYPLTVTARDELGNTGKLTRPIPVDVLVIREGNKLKVRISSITFAPDTADYLNVPADRRERNLATLARLAEIFRKYSRYDISIEGHAVMVYWNDPEKGKLEQEEVLLPLSKARAEAIKGALVTLGLDARRITTVGLGAAEPIVPFSDLENRWKDRRVEFILVRSGQAGG